MTTSFESTGREKMTRTLDVIVAAVAVVAIVTLVLEHGHYLLDPAKIKILQQIDIGIISLFMLDMVGKLLLARRRLQHLRAHAVHYSLLGLLIILLVGGFFLGSFPAALGFLKRVNIPTIAKFYIIVIQIAIVVRLGIQAMEAQKKLAHMRLRPAHLLVASFLIIILLGTVLLHSPRAAPKGEEQKSLVDSFFTATSATCVTGLIVQDTGKDFSRFGQIVILVLIQIGGLGLMTFAAFFAMIFGTGMGMKDTIVMQDVLNEHTLSKVGKLIIYILLLTFTLEAIGASLLYPIWSDSMTTGERLYNSIFHSISCFCNAGFSLYSDSFEQYCSHVGLNVIVCALIITGGLGFAVHRNLLGMIRNTWQKLPLPFSHHKLTAPTGKVRLTLHSKLVLTVTVCLLVGGTIVVFLLEQDGVLKDKPLPEQLMASGFQSVTARTAGFNTIDTSQLSNASLVFVSFLMFIGASPGSTGGGIKTVTFAILVIAMLTNLRNRSNFEVFHRTIARTLVSRAIIVVTVAGAVILTTTVLLSYFERDTEFAPGQQIMFRQVFFEVFSAFGTVGLSTGITPKLTSAGKIVIMLAMLIGRIGPLTLVLALGQQIRRADYDYPEEKIMIG